MADIPKQEVMGFLQQANEEDKRWGSGRTKKMQGTEGSFVVDMERLSLLMDSAVSAGNAATEAPTATTAAASPRAPLLLQGTLARKFSQRGERKAAGDGDSPPLPTTSTTSAAGVARGVAAAPPVVVATANSSTYDKFAPVVLSHSLVSSEAVAAGSPQQSTPRKRAHGRRVAAAAATALWPWLDPRRVLIFFATLSCMGTIILLYFTLSMGAMGDAR